MTAQIPDTLLFEGDEFVVHKHSGTTQLYSPASEVIRPVGLTSACHQGFCCQFAVSEQQLYVEQVQIGFSYLDRKRMQTSRINHFSICGVLPEVDPDPYGPQGMLYRGLHHGLDFSGGILIAKGYLPHPSVGMARYFVPLWSYEEAHELAFFEGQLTHHTNLTPIIREFRDTLVPEPPSDDFLQPLEDRRAFSSWLGPHLRSQYS